MGKDLLIGLHGEFWIDSLSFVNLPGDGGSPTGRGSSRLFLFERAYFLRIQGFETE